MPKTAPRHQTVWVVVRTGANLRPYSDLFADEREAREAAATARRGGRYAHVARLRLPAGIERVDGGQCGACADPETQAQR